MPAKKNQQRLQETFLSRLIEERTPITMFLLNGVRLQGTISSFDDFCISLETGGELQAVYKQEISTISTSAPLNLWENPDEAPARKPPPRPSRRPAAKTVVVERRRRIRTPGR